MYTAPNPAVIPEAKPKKAPDFVGAILFCMMAIITKLTINITVRMTMIEELNIGVSDVGGGENRGIKITPKIITANPTHS